MKCLLCVIAVILLSMPLCGGALGEQCLYPFQTAGKYGYIDADGSEVIPAQWEQASNFYMDCAIVGNGAIYGNGIIGTDGRYWVDMKYRIEYQNGLYVLRKDANAKDLFGFFDPQSKTIVEPQYDYIGNNRSSKSSPLILAVRNQKVGYLNRLTGEPEIPFIYDEPTDQAQFFDGYAIISIASNTPNGIDLEMHLITEDHREIRFPTGIQAYATPFVGISEGIIAVQERKSGLLGFANLEGEILCYPQYDEVNHFSEGYAAVCRDDLWGHIDKTGALAVSPRFALYDGDDAPIGYEFSNGIALLKTREAYLAINDRGEVLFSKPVDDTIIYPFMENGLALCQKDQMYGMINSKGEWVWSPRWRLAEKWSMETFLSGLEAVSVGAQYGFIDQNGEMQIDCEYDNAENFHGELALVTLNGKKAYINRKNIMVWKEK